MRRKDKQIEKQADISLIINQCQVCRVGLAKDNQPYIVPVSFGYDGDAIFFHTAAEQGMKLEFISANKQVCFEFEHGVEIMPDETNPCDWSFSFQSVIGFGIVEKLTSDDEKMRGLQRIMAQYSDKKWEFSATSLKALNVWKITIESMSGKQSKDYMKQ